MKRLRFGAWPQLVILLLASGLGLARQAGPLAFVVQIFIVGGVGSLLLQLGGMTVGGGIERGGPMAAREVVLTFAVGFALCTAGLVGLMAALDPRIVVTADTIDRLPFATLHDPATHMGLILAAWNLLVLAAGFYVARLLVAAIVALIGSMRKRLRTHR